MDGNQLMDQQPPNRRLSEISHLFLSDVRDRQTDSAPRPVRKPPGSFNGDVSVDLTPEEFAQVFSDAPPRRIRRGSSRCVRSSRITWVRTSLTASAISPARSA